MPIIDFTNVEKVYMGSVEMKKVYEGQTVVWEKPVPVDYFYIQNEHAGSNILTLTKTGSALTTASDLEYSLDKASWTPFDLTQATNTVSIPQGGKVYMRSTTGFSTDDSNCLTITTSNNCSAGGNVMSLIDYTNINSVALQTHCFYKLFMSNSHLISVNNLSLPRTTLASYCYYNMFRATGLTSLPSGFLPATTLASYCYYNMFFGCTSLTTVPDDLLPATTLTDWCYAAMFNGCTSLTQAPTLSTTALVLGCYSAMFYHCSSLNYIKCLAVDISASNCTSNWVNGVASSGTFIKNFRNTTWTTGVSGIPSGWTATSEEQSTPLYIELVNPTDTVPLQIMASGTTNKTLAYSYDNQNWTGYTATTNPYTIQLNSSNPRVYFRATSNGQWNVSGSIYWYFKKYATASDVPLRVGGNIYSLENTGTSYQTAISPRGNYSFYRLFQNFTCLTDSNKLFLGLETTTLKANCYTSMFNGCTSLTSAPALLATTLIDNCYNSMFYNCTSLTQAPTLSATTLVLGCYYQMFRGCTSLNYIKCLATNISATSCLSNWVSGVSATGTFVKASSMSSWPAGDSGIPTGWTVVNA